MTPDELRAAIAADCPHRLDDFDGHLADRAPTEAFVRLWRIEHAISSRPAVEQQIADLYEQIQTTDTREQAMPLFEEISRIRHEISEGLQ
ncbi:hypothetical protein OG594_08805 [Streptomyces sp. NBC_01214]|uniref:hypothetical protein n=1 Tax=Streptomyces sp. NBC_01214 TaxID=2903777 RepID=UPI002252415D|nr:hypothetical protein [Streptomyces sp. NBC_01214]MCX4801749.1 hypothetical protein [Streptomyces sp. NBC_01214]